MKENIYETELLDYASKLDAVTSNCGKIMSAANTVVAEKDNTATLYLINTTSSIIKSADTSREVKRLASTLKDSLLKFYGYYYILDSQDHVSVDDQDTRSMRELLDELHKLIGLDCVKSKINDLIAFQKVQMLRAEQGLHCQKGTLHMAFTGNPGTGKTTVARIVGRIYKQIGLLSEGHFVEVSRTDLIAGYQGQTALKVKKVIEKAKGGVLFIDEAYSITENDHSDSYGRECLTELTKALEDYREDLVVIVAGYTEPMEHFFASNPGLKSRFNTFIEFPDYTADELSNMLNLLCRENDYTLETDVSDLIHTYLDEQIRHKDSTFANGRLIRNIFDDLVMNHARRVFNTDSPNKDTLSLIVPADFVPISRTDPDNVDKG